MKQMILGATATISGMILFSADYIVNCIMGVMPDVSVVSSGHYSQYAICLMVLGLAIMIHSVYKDKH